MNQVRTATLPHTARRLLNATALAIALVALALPAHAGLVAHLPLDGHGNDASGHGRHGIVNGATATADRFGNPTGALAFDGIDDYVDVEQLLLDGDDATVAFAAKSFGAQNIYTVMVSQGHWGAANPGAGLPGPYATGFAFQYGWPGSANASLVWGNNFSGAHSWQALPYPVDLESDLDWHHFAVTKSGGTITIYFDGAPIGSSAPGLAFSSYRFNIGRDTYNADSNHRSFYGAIDDVRVYDHALTPVAVADLMLPPAEPSAAVTDIFFSDYGNNTIWRVAPDGSGATVIVSGLSNVRGLAVDSAAGKLYWCDLGSSTRIGRSNLDGSQPEVVLSSAYDLYPKDVDLDLVHGKMYFAGWAGSPPHGLWRSNLDGSNVEFLLTGSNPNDLTLDVQGGKVYWADFTAGTVSRANLDGSSPEVLVSGRPSPNHVALGPNGRLYWTEGESAGQLMRSNVDGSGLVTLVTGEATPTGLILDTLAGKMYWARTEGHSLVRSNLDGSAVETFFGASRPWGLAAAVDTHGDPPAGIPDLVSWWRGEENALDEVGPNDGTLVGGSGYAPGRFGESFSLDGIDGAVQVPDHSSLDGTDGLTVASWVRASSCDHPYGWCALAIKAPNGQVVQWQYALLVTSWGALGFGNGDGGSYFLTYASAGLLDGGWHHVAATYGDTMVTLYVDGVVVLASGNGIPLTPNSEALEIGRESGEPFLAALGGEVDEVMIYDRALEQSEVQLLADWEPEGYELPLSVAVTADGPLTFCSGGGVLLSATPSGGSGTYASYQWLLDGSPISGAMSDSHAAISSGSFSVTVADSQATVATSAPIAVTVHPLPAVSIAPSGPTSFCEGGTVTLNAEPAGGDFTWSTGESGDSIVVDASGSNWLSATNAHGCSANTPPIQVTVHPLPATPVISSSSSSGVATLTSSPAHAYLWSSGEQAQTISTTTSGTYSVTVYTEHACAATSFPTTVSIANGGQTVFSSGDVTARFQQVPAGAVFTADAIADPTSVAPLPTGHYQIASAGQALLAYELEMNPPGSGRIEIAFATPWAASFKELKSLRVLHGELDVNGQVVLVDRTLRHEWNKDVPAQRRVIASVGSLSPFVLARVKAPTIDGVTGPASPGAVATAVAVSATFTDPDAGDSHSAVWEWGDGTSSVGVVTEPSEQAGEEVPGAVTGQHSYGSAGVYTVRLTLSDGTAEGGATSASFQYVVVFDPEGGFVTGGGWIDSPAGAYRLDPGLSGKASFGFVAKYPKGASIPSGQTQFEFHVADLRFRSTAYEWLVVAGPKAQFKGRGTINDGGDYGFLLTATDGQAQGGGGADRFRIKIWERATGVMIYDNLGEHVDTADPQPVGGGSVVIHAAK